MIQIAGLSDLGLKRNENQDYFAYTQNLNNDYIAIVCDGVGGSAGGKLASKTVVNTIMNYFKKVVRFQHSVDVKRWINDVCQKSNSELLMIAKNHPQYVGMATTIAGVIVCEHGTFVFNAGDSRVYGLFDKFLCLTKDHTYERFLKEKGNIFPVDVSIRKDALSNAIGIYSVVEIDVIKIKSHWKKLLICSDGVHNSISIHQILNILNEIDDVQLICENYVKYCNANGGNDNITAIVIKR